MSSGSPISLPARISKYELLEFLGGGMSHVFRARDTVLGRTIAIKILTPAGVADSDTKARFLQEARVASNISHENILAVFDFGEEAGKPYMVMEFLRGRTLRSAIQDNLMTDLPTKLRIAQQVARALGYVHQNQIVHRDVKPENINLDDSGRAKLMDFGIAKSADLSLTQPGYVLGTPYYMSPEQIMGKTVTGAVDIYAFGIMLYEMLLGTRPYGGDTIETIFYKIIHEPLDLSPLALAGVPPDVVAVVARCTKKDPPARYPDFNAVATDLENALGTQLVARMGQSSAGLSGIKPPTEGSFLDKLKTPLFAGIGVGVVLLVAMVLFAISYMSGPKPTTDTTKGRTDTTKPVAKLPLTLETATGPMQLVPAGKFLFGPDNHPETLPDYYIDEMEVSNEYYGKFIDATGYKRPPGFKSDQFPVVNVSVLDARKFAEWAKKRLPTAREWEKAARGTTGNVYPWGDANDPSLANVADPRLKDHTIMRVDAFRDTKSPYHTINMIGNVSEMIDEPVTPSAGAIQNITKMGLNPPPTATERWVTDRGGHFDYPLVPQMTYDFESIPERFFDPRLGFRCVQDANIKPR